MPLIARAGSGSLLTKGVFLQVHTINMASQNTDTGKHFVPRVKIHHYLFGKADRVSVNVGGKHYLQIYDSKGAKLNEFEFTGKHYKLDTGVLAKGSYSIYVFDSQMKLLDLKPMVVK
jgi:hypothetical protein